MESELMTPVGYAELLEQLKVRIRSARLQAALAVNRELIHLYWEIGRTIPQISQQVVDQFPWGHNTILLSIVV